jgi:alpha-aminoadipic semialdehyde synthase
MPGTIGIRREDKNEWERRVPLTPRHVKILTQKGIDVQVQPSEIRVFNDAEYEEAGARVMEDLGACDIVFGVKEFPISFFRPGQSYMFFSHVIKGQEYNMPMLQRILDDGCTLLDYEKVVDEKNLRLIFFGNFAGLAGTIETLYTLGKRLDWEGVKTPLIGLKRPLHYQSLDEARAALEVVGKWIETEGFPDSISPVVVGFAGYGNVSQGAQELLDILPHEEVPPADLADFIGKGDYSRHKVYKVVFYEKDMVVPAESGYEFGLQDYFQNPEKYTGVFSQYLRHLTALVNCIYWDARYPRLVTKEWLRDNWTMGSKLKVLGDISCDYEGSVECTLKSTEPGDPIFTYLPAKDEIVFGWEGEGPVVMAVDTLPSELPRESSEFFGDQLMPFMDAFAKVDFSKVFDELDLPPEIMKSLIVHMGKLTPDFEYLQEFL